MSICTYEGESRRGNEKWGNDEVIRLLSEADHHNILVFAKNAIKDAYGCNCFIDEIVYFDDAYLNFTDSYFKEVGVIASLGYLGLRCLIVKGKRYPYGNIYVEALPIVEEVDYDDLYYRREYDIRGGY
jgi:hypothetical protein